MRIPTAGFRMVSVSFFGGVGEIGGNKILIEDGDARILLDFGVSFSSESEYFDGYLQPRRINGAGDYFEFGLLPRIEGLYAEKALQNTPLKYTPPQVDGVFITHAHVDHVGHLDFIDPKIPIHIGETAKTIIDAMRDVSPSWNYGEHKYTVFRTGSIIRAHGLEVEPVHVDHSIPGAYGFLIHTSAGTIAYTGDIRLHGSASHLTRDFIQKAHDAKPIALLCEGTRITPEDQSKAQTEADVLNASRRVMTAKKGLIIASFYGRDVDRLRTLYEASVGGHRKFVLQMRIAHLLKKLSKDHKLKAPDIFKDENVAVYRRRKDKYYKWEQELIDKVQTVDYDYIKKNKDKLVLNLDFQNLGELIDIKPAGGQFIHSQSEPFNEEGEVEEAVLRNWLQHFQMNFHQLHASGHAPANDLGKVITGIKPKNIYPIHTERPDLFTDLLKNTEIRIRKTLKATPIRLT